jgi:hypothetical protein
MKAIRSADIGSRPDTLFWDNHRLGESAFFRDTWQASMEAAERVVHSTFDEYSEYAGSSGQKNPQEHIVFLRSPLIATHSTRV